MAMERCGDGVIWRWRDVVMGRYGDGEETNSQAHLTHVPQSTLLPRSMEVAELIGVKGGCCSGILSNTTNLMSLPVLRL